MKYKNYKAFVMLGGKRTTVKTKAENKFDARRILEAQYGKIDIIQDDYEANRVEEKAERARRELEEQAERLRYETTKLEKQKQELSRHTNTQPTKNVDLNEDNISGSGLSGVVGDVFDALREKVQKSAGSARTRGARLFWRGVLDGMSDKDK